MNLSEYGYNMEEQNKIEEAVTPTVINYLEKKYNLEARNIRYLHTETDIICAGKTFDIKADTRISQTGNLFIETVSVFEKGQIKKKGWLYNSTDYILYVDVNNNRMLQIPLANLRNFEQYILNCELKKILQKNKTYETHGYLVKTSMIFLWLYSIGVNWIYLSNFIKNL